MVTFSPGMKISAVYYTSVYKSNVSGWRSEKVTAILEVISPGMAIVRSATMEPGGSKRQHYNVAKAEADEIGKKKIISKLDKVEVA